MKALFTNWRDQRNGVQSWSLWAVLVGLVVSLLATLIWLAGRYESSQIQSRLEHDAADIAVDIRTGLVRNIQRLQSLESGQQTPGDWALFAAQLLRERREIVRLEWRSADMVTLAQAGTPYRSAVFQQLGRASVQADVNQACGAAKRTTSAAYSASYFMPQSNALGIEMFDMCLPITAGGHLTGYTVATYSLQDILAELVVKQLMRGQSVALTEADGTRLALHGIPASGSRVYVAQQLLDIAGNPMVVRLETRLSLPSLFPNVLTALVAAMSLALVVVLFLLARDMRMRFAVETDLGEALAFRKAMEDSVLTGLRARDLSGRITYVNPAFCQMVGMAAKELLNHRFAPPHWPPYWPPELAHTYQQRQVTRLAGSSFPREGHESVFMRPDGTRFAVLIMEAPLINAAGQHTGWMSAILDVSEQRRIEEQSRASQDRLQATARLALVGEMASLLSHELNQPLAAISSYAAGSLNLLQPPLPLDAHPQAHRTLKSAALTADLSADLADDLRLAMRRIAEQAERAGQVIKSVHNFVRRRDQPREAVEPKALLDAVMPLVSLQARKLAVTVVTDIAPACAAVLCDRTMVEQVLLNLSRNGMQAMQAVQAIQPLGNNASAVGLASRVLTLSVKPAAFNARSRWIEFSVTDRGSGIPPSVAAQLFTPFFTTKAEGMGLGLSLCRTVIEQHGGFLGFTSADPVGTVFSFTLPVALPTAPNTSA